MSLPLCSLWEFQSSATLCSPDAHAEATACEGRFRYCESSTTMLSKRVAPCPTNMSASVHPVDRICDWGLPSCFSVLDSAVMGMRLSPRRQTSAGLGCHQLGCTLGQWFAGSHLFHVPLRARLVQALNSADAQALRKS